MDALKKIPKSITFLLGMTVLTGVIYPAAVTLIAQLAFPAKANGSLLVMNGEVRGSTLLAQKFLSPRFFQARPSATDYAYVGSGASNLGPVSSDLAKAVSDRSAAWRARFGAPAPADMLYASASGLDPDISLEAALAQADLVASARGLGPVARAALDAEIRGAAGQATTLVGPPRVNVVSLNALLETKAEFSSAPKGE
jgi:K+-transporting ATPase ATPase C chain